MPRSPSLEPRRERDSHRDRDREYDSDKHASSSRRDKDKDRYKRDDRERSEDRERKKHRDRGRDKDDEDRRGSKRDRSRSRERSHKKERKRKESRSPSPSGKSRRKEAKIAAKLQARRETELEQARALAEVSMYSATDNPFHDANLGEQFVWNKKRDKEKRAGLTLEEIARKDAIRRIEAKEELERLNKRRADREVEMALRDEEDQKMKRAAEDAAMAEWIAKEDDFQLEQSRRRAGIRLREQRAKAIDFLAINLRFADAKALGKHTAAIGVLANPRKSEIEREEEEEGWGWADAGFEFEIDEPWRIFENLNLEDCIELEQDIKMYLSLEKSPINIEFWEAMMLVCQYNLEQLRDPDYAEGGRFFDKDVDSAAGSIVSGLSLQRLDELEARTNAMLRSGQPVDGEFWDLVLKKINVEKAIARLNSIHEVVLKNRLEQFKRRQREDAAKVQAELGGVIINNKPAVQTYGGDMQADVGEDDDADDEMDEEDHVEEYDPEMSPKPVDVRTLALEERRLPIIDEEDEWRDLFKIRRQITETNYVPRQTNIPRSAPTTSVSVSRPSAADLEAERYYRAEAERERKELGSDESEEEFGDLDEGLALPSNYDWTDRYRPRKPRFFNRVHTGFEWSKYNQTHYDTDNPPPKVVQGYKFNIFYPDLIDKSKAPTYYIKRIPDDNETQMIVFTAGPPYEDIAFRIVRRPWEYSHRKGFRSMFDRGVLQLYFNFGRSFYRK
ncbi:mid region of cactin-domain-containing protein [Naematelia encephala]|uniref:Splicing factor Cactin n=1 Tax=Naematelia encephala TaxID=71784 RepID=A0A1Y2BH42_9TREE|nr:mid region of cactin-domain-containing protein [Naematelia encephala]